MEWTELQMKDSEALYRGIQVSLCAALHTLFHYYYSVLYNLTSLFTTTKTLLPNMPFTSTKACTTNKPLLPNMPFTTTQALQGMLGQG